MAIQTIPLSLVVMGKSLSQNWRLSRSAQWPCAKVRRSCDIGADDSASDEQLNEVFKEAINERQKAETLQSSGQAAGQSPREGEAGQTEQKGFELTAQTEASRLADEAKTKAADDCAAKKLNPIKSTSPQPTRSATTSR